MCASSDHRRAQRRRSPLGNGAARSYCSRCRGQTLPAGELRVHPRLFAPIVLLNDTPRYIPLHISSRQDGHGLQSRTIYRARQHAGRRQRRLRLWHQA